jgi:hypothetical protein
MFGKALGSRARWALFALAAMFFFGPALLFFPALFAFFAALLAFGFIRFAAFGWRELPRAPRPGPAPAPSAPFAADRREQQTPARGRSGLARA